ncbi:MAG: MFS transporter [Nitrospirota bacterium]
MKGLPRIHGRPRGSSPAAGDDHDALVGLTGARGMMGRGVKPGNDQLVHAITWNQTFAALRHRNYRLWFIGQLLSLLGSWMQVTAQGFLVFQLTHSPAYLGYVGFAGGVPTWLFTLYGGVVADRISRRALMIITQTAMMILALLLAALTFLDLVRPWHILVLAFCLGVANAFDAPARQAFVTDMVPREDLTNAIALNAAMFHAATTTGPAAAGLTYALFGPAWCFTVNGISFIAIIAALMMMRLPNLSKPMTRQSAFRELQEGIHHAVADPIIRTLVIIVGMTSWLGISLTTLVPAWAVKILKGDATTNGLLLSARGIGALCGALLIAALGRLPVKGTLLSLGMFGFPLFLLAFAFAHQVPLSLLFILGVGMGLILVLNLANALVQTLTPESLRGRVMSVYMMTFFGLMPVGSMWIGMLAEHFGEGPAVIINGLLALLFAAAVWTTVPKLRTQQ